MLGFMFCSFFLAQVYRIYDIYIYIYIYVCMYVCMYIYVYFYRIYVNSRKLMGKTNGVLLLTVWRFFKNLKGIF